MLLHIRIFNLGRIGIPIFWVWIFPHHSHPDGKACRCNRHNPWYHTISRFRLLQPFTCRAAQCAHSIVVYIDAEKSYWSPGDAPLTATPAHAFHRILRYANSSHLPVDKLFDDGRPKANRNSPSCEACTPCRSTGLFSPKAHRCSELHGR